MKRKRLGWLGSIVAAAAALTSSIQASAEVIKETIETEKIQALSSSTAENLLSQTTSTTMDQLDISSESVSASTEATTEQSEIVTETEGQTSSMVSEASPSVSIESSQSAANTAVGENTESSNTAPSQSAAGRQDEGMDESEFVYTPNYSTHQFILEVGEAARELGQEHDVYASVMIAQAILESGSGNSRLSSPPNHNLFGIKGSYEGNSIKLSTKEDDGTGDLYTVTAAFRIYPSYKESLEDYVQVIRGGLPHNQAFYAGTWKSRTASYQDATAYLTGRYATDTQYSKKLNALIEAYNLTQYDDALPETATSSAAVEPVIEKEEATISEVETAASDKPETVTSEKPVVNHQDWKCLAQTKPLVDGSGLSRRAIWHEVQLGESLMKISQLYQIPLRDIAKRNQLKSAILQVGQHLQIDTPIDLPDKVAMLTDMPMVTHSSYEQEPPKHAITYHVTASQRLPSTMYRVKRGDSLKSIAEHYGMSIYSLKSWNDLTSYVLVEDQIVHLVPPALHRL